MIHARIGIRIAIGGGSILDLWATTMLVADPETRWAPALLAVVIMATVELATVISLGVIYRNKQAFIARATQFDAEHALTRREFAKLRRQVDERDSVGLAAAFDQGVKQGILITRDGGHLPVN